MVRFLLIIRFIYAAVRHGVAPYRFFQLNARYFNEQKGIFSKLDIDQLIPERFRLWQKPDNGDNSFSFPVFIKPEWGQNSHSVSRADNPEQLARIRNAIRRGGVDYIIQEAAPGKREFEIFYIRSAENFQQAAIFSVTETVNEKDGELPVNSINPVPLYPG